MIVYFFFSSRRRHTRWPRDWSSDVCSSDLAGWWIGDVRLVVIDGEDESETVLLDAPVPEAAQGQGSLVHFVRQDDKAEVGFGGLSVAEDGVYSIDLTGSVKPRADFSHMDRAA